VHTFQAMSDQDRKIEYLRQLSRNQLQVILSIQGHLSVLIKFFDFNVQFNSSSKNTKTQLMSSGKLYQRLKFQSHHTVTLSTGDVINNGDGICQSEIVIQVNISSLYNCSESVIAQVQIFKPSQVFDKSLNDNILNSTLLHEIDTAQVHCE